MAPTKLQLTVLQSALITRESENTGIAVDDVLSSVFVHGLGVWRELRDRLETIRLLSNAGKREYTAVVNTVAQTDATEKTE